MSNKNNIANFFKNRLLNTLIEQYDKDNKKRYYYFCIVAPDKDIEFLESYSKGLKALIYDIDVYVNELKSKKNSKKEE